MSKQTIKIKLLREGAVLPNYQTAGAAAVDLQACFSDANDIKVQEGPAAVISEIQYHCNQSVDVPVLHISPGQRVIIPTGIALAIPEGYECQVRPRSGVTFKQGLLVANSPGTIDSDYRGEVGVILINQSNQVQSIKNGDRIAQLVLAKVERLAWEQTEDLGETQRADGGFGSTGK